MQQHLRYAVMDLAELEPFSGNARRHNDTTLNTSARVHGQYRTIVVRRIDGQHDNPYRYVILCGHGTADALRVNGHEKARVEVIECSDEEALAINLMDNRSSDTAFYDDDDLAAQLAEVRDLDLWEATGWDEKSAQKYLNGEQEEAEEPPAESWAVIVNCSGEEQQALLLDRFTAEGLDCRALTT